jgi:enoyl-CoA hydratase
MTSEVDSPVSPSVAAGDSEPRVRYEQPAPRVARIVLARASKSNAQDTQMLYELNDAFDRAAQDDDIHVIILAADGPHFSSGHDTRENTAGAMDDYRTVGTWCGFNCDGAEAQMAREKEIYLGFSERWRNIPKPTIAQVQGMVVAGGLMLMWPCDLIVAADNALFVDNTVAMGIPGAEFFNHPWELGIRRAKELLFTSDAMTARDAQQLGMVNRVVPLADIEAETLELAGRIAAQPLFGLKLVKEAINGAQDAQGRTTAMRAQFALHQLSHSHNVQLGGRLVHPTFADRRGEIAARWRETAKSTEQS